jgi:hypothetical protein
MKFSKIITLVFLIFFSLGSFSQELPEGGEGITDPAEIRLLKEKQKARDLFFEANKAKITDNIETALSLFGQCTEADPKNDAAWYELSLLYYNQNDLPKSISNALK